MKTFGIWQGTRGGGGVKGCLREARGTVARFLLFVSLLLML